MFAQMCFHNYSDQYIIPTPPGNVVEMDYPCNDSTKCVPFRVDACRGTYEIEVWGAVGGDAIAVAGNRVEGGCGGYVKVNFASSRPISLYFYIGAKGDNSSTASYNGGGQGPLEHPHDQGKGAGGGGATDVRLFPAFLDAKRSIRERIIVAGAGGGACSYMAGSRGGDNLGLEGESGIHVRYDDFTNPGVLPTGGTQTSPGTGFITFNGVHGKNGSLGQGGGLETVYTGAGAGGSGFYGGGSGGWTSTAVCSGAAGSSFASGCSECAVISGLPILTGISMLGGNESLPSPSGTTEIGHKGNGFARIKVINGCFTQINDCDMTFEGASKFAAPVIFGHMMIWNMNRLRSSDVLNRMG